MSHSSHGRGHGMPSLAREGAPALRTSHSGSAGSIEIFTPRGHASSEPLVSNDDLSELVSRFQALSMSATSKAVRPGFGTRGSPVKLRANMFQLNYPKDVVLFDYVIKVQPVIGKDDEDLRKHVVKLFSESRDMSQFSDGIALDGARRLIAKLPLPRNLQVKVKVRLPVGKEGRPVETAYTITLTGPRELKSADLARFLRGADPNYNPAPIISAFNLIVTSHAARTGFRASGKHAYYFGPNVDTGVQTRAGIKAVNGFFATVRPVFKNLMVNVNACMSAFYIPGDLSDAMVSFQRHSQGATHPSKFFGRMRVTTAYHGYSRRSTVKGFGSESAKKTTIRTEEFGKTTVENYFAKKYGIALQHAHDLPVVNVGAGDKDVLVPAELCKIEPGTLFTGRLTHRESAALCAANSRNPAGNAQTITVKGLRLLGLEEGASPLPDFNISVSLNMAVISARVLPSPKVLYQTNQPTILNGSWSTRGIQFEKPAQLKRLAVLVLRDANLEGYTSNTEAQLREAVGALLGTCRLHGMAVEQDHMVRVLDLPRPNADDPYRDEAIEVVEKALRSFPSKPNMVLALVSNRDPQINAGLRRLFDVELGCQSLCALISNMLDKEGRARYLTNLAFKMNAKLGGINHRLEPGSVRWLENTMLVGMDASHSGAGAREGAPSVAAVVASCDPSFMRYPASVSKQEKITTIANLKDMFIERLKAYRENMNKFPDRIVIFRAGVSNGQVDKVMKVEVGELKKVFRDLKDYKPKVTYVVCGKGHNTRFYPTKAADADKTSNSVAGTVVDQGVTSVYDFDFYLQAHAATQGMARATHYTVVYDENKFPPDVLQQGINDLSYLWAPATKSVSLVPPAYWADRACARARLYMYRVMSPIEGSKETRLSKEDTESRTRGLWARGVHGTLADTMYYM